MYLLRNLKSVKITKLQVKYKYIYITNSEHKNTQRNIMILKIIIDYVKVVAFLKTVKFHTVLDFLVVSCGLRECFQ